MSAATISNITFNDLKKNYLFFYSMIFLTFLWGNCIRVLFLFFNHQISPVY